MLIRFEYGETCPLLESYRKGDIDEFRNLINSGANINFRTNKSRSLIRIVISNHNEIPDEKNRQFFNELLNAGVYLEKLDEGNSPLLASMVETDEIYYMEELLKRGVEINNEYEYVDYYNMYRRMPPIFRAVKECPIEKIDLLMSYKPNLKIKDSLRSSLLHELIGHNIKNSDQIMSILLSAGADPNALNYDKESVLHKLSRGAGKSEIDNYKKYFDILLKYNADINIKNKRGDTPIMCACKHNNKWAMKILAERNASFTEKNNAGMNCVMHAAHHRRYDMLNFFEVKGVDFSDCDNEGQNAAHYIVSIKRNPRNSDIGVEKMKFLKKHYKLLLVKDDYDQTPLDIIKSNHTNSYKELQNFLDSKNKTNDH